MNEVEIKKLWNLLISKFDMGDYTYEQFKQKMSTPEGVDGFYKKYGKELGLNNNPKPVQKKVAPSYSSTFKSKPCDENTFPWTKGCMNNKIGQMNQVYFGDRYGNIYGDDLYYQLRSLGYFSAQGQKDGEITQYIYDGVMKDSLQENEISERKKVVKETVKKVLKERLNKD